MLLLHVSCTGFQTEKDIENSSLKSGLKIIIEKTIREERVKGKEDNYEISSIPMGP